ncbi:Verru_Chthon cassette protein A [Verrucomicrobium sp. GAS474]|uniref:Verru_Chthon cassette protein A n=1 Tax=Verrucomicrobium sp. GAS474 TaxID=1882831 RepID=UPI00138FA4DF|nr:Verru_Chthon cassette protein A [Verrucomicrobium sp. GAS474]
MKLPPRRSGFALLLVLGMLVLIVGLAVGFLMSSTTELRSASGFGATVAARNLADTAVGLVQGQINLAATQGTGVAWVSQPGMVRTYDTAGSLKKAYKLYSAANMISSTVDVAGGKSADEPPAAWKSSPALWTDLNAPVQTSNGKVYPILDGSVGSNGLKPEGFSLGTVPGASSWQPIPMPVRWLYVLQDGTMVAATGSGKSATVAGASAANPIVGRVAFWTDDDSCKVNINTAGEGTYWNTPHTVTANEVNWGKYQPAKGEFQRYPGHPAMTCLSSVLGVSPSHATLSNDDIYAITPRISTGGSNGKTVVAGTTSTAVGTTIPTAAIAAKTQRLYASVDELAFNVARTQNSTKITPTDIAQARFFLTANSRAPETNLFNLPRIACWPVYSNLAPTRTTSYDQLIAFCASTSGTAGNNPYYFQRQTNTNPTTDISLPRNGTLYKYLRTLTGRAIPGFGNNFLTKYSDDRDQILTEIFDYIRCTNLYDDSMTGTGKTPYTQAPGAAGHGWVAPTVNNITVPVTQGLGRSFTLSSFGIGFICNADAAVPRSNDLVNNKALRNTGNVVLAPGEKVVQAILIPQLFAPMMGYTTITPSMKMTITGQGAMSLTALPGGGTSQLFTGTAISGTENYNGLLSYIINGGSGWGGHPSWRFFTNAYGGSYPWVSVPVKLAAGTTSMLLAGTTLIVTFTDIASGQVLQTFNVPLPSVVLPIPALVNDPSLVSPPTTDLPNWWSFGVNFPNTSAYPSIFGTFPGRLSFVSSKGQGGATTPQLGNPVIDTYDVVRTVQPAHGDFRVLAGLNNVPASTYIIHPDYRDTTKMWASTLTEAYSTASTQGLSLGSYFPSTITAAQYRGTLAAPDIIPSATGTNTPEGTGDFDSGLPNIPDGAYINKPDEGLGPGAAGASTYFDYPWTANAAGVNFFSPNRQIPSPGMFGSLPTGVKAGVPWRTLLFHPQTSHFGSSHLPEDHLFLDLFWMPVVEPYAISDRFSTAGKINMNYQILPFTYINRSTGLNALLKSERVYAIPNADVQLGYKVGPQVPAVDYPVDATQTLAQFQTKFQSGDVYRSASEICDLHIVPLGLTGASVATMANTTTGGFWAGMRLTGENLRERIYTTLYPRLTTKSNTYTVHFRAQSLKKAAASIPSAWQEGADVVTGEYRGSATIERFIDANNTSIPDYGTNPDATPTLDTYYRWRVIRNRQFSP